MEMGKREVLERKGVEEGEGVLFVSDCCWTVSMSGYGFQLMLFPTRRTFVMTCQCPKELVTVQHHGTTFRPVSPYSIAPSPTVMNIQ